MDNSKILKSLLAVVEKQQNALKKLAQALPPQNLGSAGPTLRTAEVIMQQPEYAKFAPYIERLEVSEATDEVKVKFKAGATQNTVTALQQLVDSLVSSNTITRGNPLKVTPV